MGLNPDGLGRTVRENLLPVYTNHTCLATLIAEATQALKEQHSPPPHYVSGGRLVQHTGRAGITRKIEVMEIKEQRNSTRVIKHKTCFITVSAMDFRCYKLSIVWFWRNLKSVYSFFFFFIRVTSFLCFLYKKKKTLSLVVVRLIWCCTLKQGFHSITEHSKIEGTPPIFMWVVPRFSGVLYFLS